MLLAGRYQLELLTQHGPRSAWKGTCGQRLYFAKSTPLAEPGLRQEAAILQRLPLGHFPRFVELLTEADQLFLVTEFLEGTTLEDEVLSNPWTWPEEAELRQLAVDLCALLEAVHALKLLFVDLKPANVLRHPDGRLFLVDFGLARSGGDGPCEGSPQTASPEHYTGKLDRRSDLFTLAATVHYVATRGQAARAPHGPFPAVRDYHPGVSEELDGWLARCLALVPGQRFPDVAAARAALAGEAPKKKGWFSWLKG